MGCLIMLIWMVLYYTLWNLTNTIRSGINSIIFKKIVLNIYKFLPFPTNYKKNWKPRKEGYHTSFVKGKEMTNYQIPYNKIGKILYRLFCIIIREL